MIKQLPNTILRCLLPLGIAWASMPLYADNSLTGGGTAEDPYVISSKEDWTAYANIVTNTNQGACAKLAGDISVSSAVATTSSKPFTGTIDGNGHKITLTLSGGKYTALFNYAQAATVKNLWIDGTITATGTCCAALFGDVKGSGSITTITNCISSVTITTSLSGDATAGGFVGDTYGGGSTGTVNFVNCLFNGEIIGGNANNCGGILGYDNGQKSTFTHCFVTARFKVQDGSGTDNGKTLVRHLKTGSATDCYYYPSFGVAYGNDAQGATQLTDIDYRMGGVAYLMQKYSDDNKLAEGNSFFFGKAVPTSYSSLHIFDEGDGTGFCTDERQRVYQFTVTTPAYDATTTTLSDKPLTFYGNSGQDVSTLVQSVLGFTATGLGTLTTDGQNFSGDLGLGTQTATIASADDWNRFCWRVNCNGETALNATMTGDVSGVQLMAADPGDVTGYYRFFGTADKKVGRVQSPIIKLTSQAYAGTFNGQGHTLTLAYTDDYCANQPFYTAPFRYVKNGATIENLHVAGTITAKGKCAGGLVGSGADGGASTDTATVSNCRVSTTINCQLATELLGITTYFSNDATLGGFFGDNQKATIAVNNSLFDGTFTSTSTSASNFSGFLGYNNGGSFEISNSLCASDFSSLSGNHAIGRASSALSNVKNCYSLYTLTNLDNATVLAADSFSAGALAWQLQGTQNDLVWGQNISKIGGAENDAYPYPVASSLSTEEARTAHRVWRVAYCKLVKNSDGTPGESWKYTLYTNNNVAPDFPSYSIVDVPEGRAHFYTLGNKAEYTKSPAITSNTTIIADEYRRDPEDLYVLVGSSDEWDYLADQYAAGKGPGFSDVRFDAPFTTTKKCGTYTYPFGGAVDGNEQTVTLNLSYTDGQADDQAQGLFGYVSYIQAKNLTVDGTINTNGQYAAGIVGNIKNGSSTASSLSDCVSNVAITSDYSGDATHGGVVAVNNPKGTIISNCAFTGSINAPDAYGCAGIVGWGESGTTVNNCWNEGKFTLSTKGTDSDRNTPIMRGYGTVTDCYYTQWPYTTNTSDRGNSIALKDVKRGVAAVNLQGTQTDGHWTQQFGVGPKVFRSADKNTQNDIYYDATLTTDSKWHCADLKMKDFESKTTPNPYYQSFTFLADKVAFTRTFSTLDKPQYTLMLPFTIPADKKDAFGTFYTFDKIENDEVKMTALGTDDAVAASTAYIFSPKNASFDFGDLGAVTLATDALPTELQTGLVGRYDLEILSEDQPNYYHFASGDGTTGVKAGVLSWCKKGAGTAPYRAFFYVAPTTAAAKKSYRVVFGEPTTGIGGLKVNDNAADNDAWFTLSGEKLGGKPSAKGLYIHGNKKVIIR